MYDKNNDQHFSDLWSQIKIEAQKQIDTQIRHKHINVFDVCTGQYIGQNAAKDLLFILAQEISYEEFINADVYFTPIRKIMEDFFKACNRYGFLPDDFVHPVISLNEAGKFLAGYKQ